MDKIHMDLGRAREDCIRRQIPLIYTCPSKDRPSMIELHYDMSTVQFRSETGGVSGVSLTDEARRDLDEYLALMKNRGIADAGNILEDKGWLMMPQQNRETIARDLEMLLRNPHNWVLESWAEERKGSILHRLLEKKRQDWDQERLLT